MRCAYVYSYAEEETTYFGCLRKVFSPELDLGVFLDEDGRVSRSSDPFGSIRATRSPQIHCPASIERAYPGGIANDCQNPWFIVGRTKSPGRRD